MRWCLDKDLPLVIVKKSVKNILLSKKEIYLFCGEQKSKRNFETIKFVPKIKSEFQKKIFFEEYF